MSDVFTFLRLAPEGGLIIISAALLFCLWFVVHRRTSILALILLGFVVFFFRDPQPSIPVDNTSIVSPASGTVADISQGLFLPDSTERYVRVGIFLSIFNVHVQRAPCDAEVVAVFKKTGKNLPAYDVRASSENNANLIILKTAFGTIAVKQITGIIAQRLVCDLKPGDMLKKGDRLGVIRFGSRVELYLPSEAVDVLCSVKERMNTGETIVSRIVIDQAERIVPR